MIFLTCTLDAENNYFWLRFLLISGHVKYSLTSVNLQALLAVNWLVKLTTLTSWNYASLGCTWGNTFIFPAWSQKNVHKWFCMFIFTCHLTASTLSFLGANVRETEKYEYKGWKIVHMEMEDRHLCPVWSQKSALSYFNLYQMCKLILPEYDLFLKQVVLKLVFVIVNMMKVTCSSHSCTSKTDQMWTR